MKTVYDYSKHHRRGYSLPENDISGEQIRLPPAMRRLKPPRVPRLDEVSLVRHYTELSRKNYSVDTGFYPLGSCSMKYNPKINEELSGIGKDVHPFVPGSLQSPILELLYELEEWLCEICGMDAATLQPYAGSHGEFTGLKIIQAYHYHKGHNDRNIILIPDSAHGTNPASASMAGFKVVEIKSNENGLIDISSIKPYLNDQLAGIMMTNPNTLGLFEEHIADVADAIHTAGGLLYYDGANSNALLGLVRPGDMGFDVMHVNTHKTFATPHGGGGPGAGPVLVKKHLESFLPNPGIQKGAENTFTLENIHNNSIGRIASHYGNTGVLLRAYMYIKSLGAEGLKQISRDAILNANYLKTALEGLWPAAGSGSWMHEFVLSAAEYRTETSKAAQKAGFEHGAGAYEIAKRLIDYGIHPPTVYFPLIVHEALMIEPTESESKESLDRFIKIAKTIYREGVTDINVLKNAPISSTLGKFDEAEASRKPRLRIDF